MVVSRHVLPCHPARHRSCEPPHHTQTNQASIQGTYAGPTNISTPTPTHTKLYINKDQPTFTAHSLTHTYINKPTNQHPRQARTRPGCSARGWRARRARPTSRPSPARGPSLGLVDGKGKGKRRVLVYMRMTNGGRGRIGFVHAHIYTHPQVNKYI